MRELRFAVAGAEAVTWSAVPQIAFRLEVKSSAPIRNLALQCQIQIEPVRRRYTSEEQQRLADLFGEPSRWGETLKTMLWTHVPLNAASFEHTTNIDALVPCTFDFNVAVTKYLYGLDDGEIPLRFLFSGSVFFDDAEGRLQITQLSWNCEAMYRLPVAVWRQLMDAHYPNSAWLTLRRDLFERLLQYKTEHGLTTWEQTMEKLLSQSPLPAARGEGQGEGRDLA
jgi:hypothetical protein